MSEVVYFPNRHRPAARRFLRAVGDVISFRPHAPEPPICVDDEHVATWFLSIIRNAIIDAETKGLSLIHMRTALVNLLQYLDAKLAMKGLKS